MTDIERSLAIYTGVFGFTIHIRRREETFAYLVRDGAHLMLEEGSGPGRRFRTAPLEKPYGRGVNIQIEVLNVDELWTAVQHAALQIVIPIEERWYRHDDIAWGNRQFVVADPDGYLLRFFENLGSRKA